MDWRGITRLTALAVAITLGGTALTQPALANTAQTPAATADAAPAETMTTITGPTQVLAMQTDAYRRMTVAVQLNGQGPYRFMVDTGAQSTVLSHALADQLQLGRRATATLVGMSSTRQVPTARIDQLTFGNHSASDARAALVDGANIGGADGILGLDSLQDRRVLLDFSRLEMQVAHVSERVTTRGYDIVVRARRRNGQLIIASAEIDGVRTAVLIDTGAQGSIGNAALQQRLRRRGTVAQTEMIDINGVLGTGDVQRVRHLDFGRAQISNFAITFTPSPTFAALDLVDEPALILGMNELHLFERVAIDFPSRRVLLDLPEGAGLPGADAFSRFAD